MGFLQKLQGASYALFRIIFGALFAIHGAQKIFSFPVAPPVEIERFGQIWIGGVLELALGVLVAAGLFTRVAAFLSCGMMAVAYFQFHKGYELADYKWMPLINGGEMAVMYCFAFLYIACHGGGKASIDRS